MYEGPASAGGGTELRAVLTHLSGPFQGETLSVDKERFLVGGGPASDVRLDPDPASVPRAEIFLDNFEYYLRDLGSPDGTLVNARPVDEIILQDGDHLQFGPAGPKLRFRRESAEGEVQKPLGIAVRDSVRKAGRFGERPSRTAVTAVREIPRALLRDTSSRARAVLAGVLALSFAVSGAVLVQSVVVRRRLEREIVRVRTETASDRSSLESLRAEVDEERRKVAAALAQREEETKRQVAALLEQQRVLRERLSEAEASATSRGQEIAELKRSLSSNARRIAAQEQERTLAERVIRDKAGGVALVEGAYTFADAEGKPLRELVNEKGTSAGETAGRSLYTTAGSGPVVRKRYTGTAFLVSGKGNLLTNRHVAEPWWHDDEAQELAARGFRPRLESLRAYFPALQEPVSLEVVRVSTKADVALVRGNLGGRRLPVLQIEKDPRTTHPGQPVILIGYPTGLDALLARLDEKVVDPIVSAVEGDGEKIAAELARRHLIRPLATQGHLGDILENRLTYDAPTALGGSGGPVFNQRGKVIGINAAFLRDFGGATFGVPISYASELLHK
ncbi:MAG: trypsin-like peptidase domain-containing protein [Acidithiobacillales bacterium]